MSDEFKEGRRKRRGWRRAEWKAGGHASTPHSTTSLFPLARLLTLLLVPCACRYFVFIWWVVGVYWLATAEQCGASGGSALWRYSLVLVVLYGVRLALPVFFIFLLCLCLPCALLLVSYLQPNPGASKETIRALPTRVWSAPEGAARRGGGSGAAGEVGGEATSASCPICMEDYVEGDVLRCLPCNVTHEFHVACCDRWLESNSTCPLCRTAISEKGREEQERERQREREQERLDREERERREREGERDVEDGGDPEVLGDRREALALTRGTLDVDVV